MKSVSFQRVSLDIAKCIILNNSKSIILNNNNSLQDAGDGQGAEDDHGGAPWSLYQYNSKIVFDFQNDFNSINCYPTI